MRTTSSQRNLARIFYRWHRRIGVSAAVFLLWILCSGLLLNHSEQLQLDKIQLHNSGLARWYNLETEVTQNFFPLGQHWVVKTSEGLMLDGNFFSPLQSPLIGVANSEQLMAIASQNELLLLDSHATLIDRLSGNSLPVNTITAVGSACQGIAISNGTQGYSSQDGLDWQACAEPLVTTPSQQLDEAKKQQMTPPVAVDKLLLDLHTGHFFGRAGVWLVDTVAIGLFLLALSGLWLFFRMGKKNNRKSAHNTSHHNSHS